MRNSEVAQMDLGRIWHPCTQMKDHEKYPLIPIQRGEGVYLYDFEGNKFLDGISSWWVNLFGHCNPYINQKIKNQLETLEHIIFAGFTHQGAIDLSQRICSLLPKALNKIFFADNGSSAVEVALKMSFHFYRNRGEIRPYFISLQNSYHGETLGALALGDVALYKETYKELLLKTFTITKPSELERASYDKSLSELESLLKTHEGKIGGIILEPLLQCAGNMNMYESIYLREVEHLARRYGIHILLDEIATGFGRCGSMFAFEESRITPDFITLSKGITGGYLPLSLVVTTQEIYDAFYCDYNEYKAFLHSHSYTANPLACAAANATLDIFENENILESNKQKSTKILSRLQKLTRFERVQNIRQKGMVCAFEIAGFDPKERIGMRLYTELLALGILLRPLGNTLYFMPPYVISESEIDFVFDGLETVLSAL